MNSTAIYCALNIQYMYMSSRTTSLHPCAICLSPHNTWQTYFVLLRNCGSARRLSPWLNEDETGDFTLNIKYCSEPVLDEGKSFCINQYCLTFTTHLCWSFPLLSHWFTGQCPSGAFCHTGKTQGQRPVWVGDDRAVRWAGIWGTRVHRRRATAHQQTAVPVVLLIIGLSADHVAYSRPFTGSFRPVPTPARVRRGAAKGEEACPMSAALGAGCHRWWRRQ